MVALYQVSSQHLISIRRASISSYIAWYFRRPSFWQDIRGQSTGTVNRRERLHPDQLLRHEVALPALDEQRRIVDLLERAAGIRRLREQALAKSRAIVPALFLDMFGDFASGSRLPIRPLEDVAAIGSGITKGRKLNGRAVEATPYLRVANVQDGFLNLTEIKTIPATNEDRIRYRLQPGDLVMTEGGDPDKLGRAAIWAGRSGRLPPPESCIPCSARS